MRVIFVIVPDFAFQAHQGDDGPLCELDEDQRQRALLVVGEGGRARIKAVAPALREEGVRANMTIADARALVGHVWPLAYAVERVEEESSRLGGVLLAASPQVHVVGDGVFWVGADGCRYLGGEATIFGLVAELVRQAGHREPRLGLASSVIAARAAAIHRLGIIAAGGDMEALAPLPVTVLPLEKATREALWALGVRTVGAFATLPASQISARFGVDAVRAYDLARGVDPRTVSVFSEAEAPTIEVDFETPHSVAEPALFVLQGGMEKLIAPHRARGFGVQCLKIELALLDGRWEREIRPADPMNDPNRLVHLCRAVLQDAELPSMMTGIRASVAEVGPAKARQEGMWESRRKRTATLEYTLMRLQGRLGAQAVRIPGMEQDAHLPEQTSSWAAVRLRSSAKGGTGDARSPCVAWRIKSPPQRVSLELDEGIPGHVEVNGSWASVSGVAGPQRIETGWFLEASVGANDNGDADSPEDAELVQPIRRDYWYAELEDSMALSLYQDLSTGEWYVQGVMD